MTIDERYTHFREVARSLWNSGFCHIPELQNWDTQIQFQRIVEELFQLIVLIPSGIEARIELPWPETEPTEMRVVPIGPGVRILVDERDPSDSVHVYGYEATEVGEGVAFRFLEPFDWDCLGVRDFQYVRVLILSWPSAERWVGHFGLIASRDALLEISTGPPGGRSHMVGV